MVIISVTYIITFIVWYIYIVKYEECMLLSIYLNNIATLWPIQEIYPSVN